MHCHERLLVIFIISHLSMFYFVLLCRLMAHVSLDIKQAH